MARNIELIGLLEGLTIDARIAEIAESQGLSPDEARMAVEHEIWAVVKPKLDDMPLLRSSINAGRAITMLSTEQELEQPHV